MGSIFKSPHPPSVTMPPPAAHPQILGSQQTQVSAQASRAAAAAAEGLGMDDTIKTSPQGLKAPATARTTLLGQ